MGDDIFDIFGGTTNLPEDSGDELDLSGLGSTPSADPGSAEASSSSAEASTKRDQDRSEPEVESTGKPATEADDTHWIDLASTLGVAIGSTQFEEPSPKKSGSSRSPAARKGTKPKPPAKPAEAEDESWFGRGLLDEVPEPEDIHRQKQVLSEMFVPTGEPFEEPSSVRQVDDVEVDASDLTDDETVDDEMPDDVELDGDTVDLEMDVVEFEVEELSDHGESRPSSFGRPRRDDRDGSRRSGSSEPRRSREEEPSSRDRNRSGRDRDDRGRSRRDERGRDRPARRRPPQSESRPRSQVLPADEDFIVDPVDDEMAEQQSANPAESQTTKSIKFPTWLETVSPIIEANLARRGKPKGRPRRHHRDRGPND